MLTNNNRIIFLSIILITICLYFFPGVHASSEKLPPIAAKWQAGRWNIALVKVEKVKKVYFLRLTFFYSFFNLRALYEGWFRDYRKLAVVEVEEILQDKNNEINETLRNNKLKIIWGKSDTNCNYSVGDRKLIFAMKDKLIRNKLTDHCSYDCHVSEDDRVKCTSVYGGQPKRETFKLDDFIREARKHDNDNNSNQTND